LLRINSNVLTQAHKILIVSHCSLQLLLAVCDDIMACTLYICIKSGELWASHLQGAWEWDYL